MFTLLLSAALCIALITIGEQTASGASDTPSTRVVVKNQGFLPFADAPINYRSCALNDPVARLEKRLERGDIKLRYEGHHGYLKSVLDALHISVSSQTLVFSKTSFQSPNITPAAPRALYYNDDVYVGQVHDGRFLEFVSFDPMQGAIFYVMDEHRDKHPRFERSEVDCIQCHVAGSTKGVPGVMLRSVFTKPDGTADAAARSFITGQESPLSQRWGGWYVTAKSGSQGAMANALISDPQHPEQLDRTASANLTGLNGRFDTSAYLTGSSDIVALMVLAHQTQMHNWITLTNYSTRLALADSKQTLEDARKKFEGAAEQLVRYLLFTNEVPLSNPIAGTSDFARQFAARGARDSQGRSLRDFDLQKRIFKYPCSYLIYSEAFDAIPAPAKDYIYGRLFEILSGREQGPEFAALSSQDRRAIIEILVATKPGIPEAWKEFVRDGNQGLTSRARVGAAHLQP
ncbi:MAG: hypothetical protein JOZ32_15680 [Bryobacterales bacterium]|nr:hypothetical protein [Bryobacterales bacterium]